MFPFNMDLDFLGFGRTFQEIYKCFPVAMLPGNVRVDLEGGGKIIMPPSALEFLTRRNVEYPMMFKLTNINQKRATHAGVLEFIAEEGRCYLPHWMMQNLLLTEGGLIKIERVSLPVATFSKFRPENKDFMEITNPKAVLENALRGFACLTTGEIIAINYNQKVYELCVLETRPSDAVNIIECDMNVEFDAPRDYEPVESRASGQPTEDVADNKMEVVDDAFQGAGVRLDGKQRKFNQMDEPKIKKVSVRGIPDYDYKVGFLKFDRSITPISDRKPKKSDEKDENEPSGFSGKGSSMI